jgi:hypothetical protein
MALGRQPLHLARLRSARRCTRLLPFPPMPERLDRSIDLDALNSSVLHIAAIGTRSPDRIHLPATTIREHGGPMVFTQ